MNKFFTIKYIGPSCILLNLSFTTLLLHDILYDVILLAETLVIKYTVRRLELYDILAFTKFLFQNFEVSHMTGSIVLHI